MQAETYLLRCQRYIELNPVRAGMVSDPGDYPWSSYRIDTLGFPKPVLSPHSLYLPLSTNNSPRHDLCRDVFRTAIDDSPLADLRMAFNQDQPLGNSGFQA